MNGIADFDDWLAGPYAGRPGAAAAGSRHASAAAMTALSASIATLLRTRAPYEPETLARQGLADSILGYGMPDLGMHDPETPRGRAAIGNAVLSAIRRCEPRLDNVLLLNVRLAPSLALVVELRASLRGAQAARPLAIRAQLDRGRNLTNLRCEPAS